MKNKALVILILCSIVALSGCSKSNGPNTKPTTCDSQNSLDSILTPISVIESAYANKVSNLSVTVKGPIIRILSDDTVGDRHQRFIIRLSNNQTLLIAHNIDIGNRVIGIAIGSIVYVHGDYVWNDEGGMIHWTHHDPDGVHENGWIVSCRIKYD